MLYYIIIFTKYCHFNLLFIFVIFSHYINYFTNGLYKQLIDDKNNTHIINTLDIFNFQIRLLHNELVYIQQKYNNTDGSPPLYRLSPGWMSLLYVPF